MPGSGMGDQSFQALPVRKLLHPHHRPRAAEVADDDVEVVLEDGKVESTGAGVRLHSAASGGESQRKC